MKIKIIFLSILFAAGLSSCCKKDCCKKECEEPAPNPIATFDKQVMLENIGNNLIIANYTELNTEVNELGSAISAFTGSPNQATLDAARTAFKEAYKAWQHSSVYELGPATDVSLRANVNTFPTDTAQINSNISSGSYNLSYASNMDAKGFPGLDYLLFIPGGDSLLLAKYTSDANAENRKAYINALASEINTLVKTVSDKWISSGGNYIATFVNAQGTDVGSSLGLLVNQLNYDWELIKNPKIGIPLGKKSLGDDQPERVEAYYSGISMVLTIENFYAIQNLYLGKSKNGIDGSGLDDYLVFLKSQHNGGLLSDAIKAQFINTSSALAAVPDPLSHTVVSNPAIVDKAYTEIQKQLVLFKTDMPSAMGILITYQDNDGD